MRSLYEQIRHEIITMEIKPGTDLDEKSLVKRFGVSRTPVREALIRLSAEGLVDIRKNKGATVTPLDLLTLQSIFEAGDLIERAFTRLACFRRTQQDIQRIETALETFSTAMQRRDIPSIVESNSQFHLSIARSSKNKYFIESYRRILADHERIAQMWYAEQIHRGDGNTIDAVDRQHNDLRDALINRDADWAESISIEHSNFCKEGIRNNLIRGEGITSNISLSSEVQ